MKTSFNIITMIHITRILCLCVVNSAIKESNRKPNTNTKQTERDISERSRQHQPKTAQTQTNQILQQTEIKFGENRSLHTSLARPVDTNWSAVSRMSCSLISQRNLFQVLKPCAWWIIHRHDNKTHQRTRCSVLFCVVCVVLLFAGYHGWRSCQTVVQRQRAAQRQWQQRNDSGNGCQSAAHRVVCNQTQWEQRFTHRDTGNRTAKRERLSRSTAQTHHCATVPTGQLILHLYQKSQMPSQKELWIQRQRLQPRLISRSCQNAITSRQTAATTKLLLQSAI